MTSQYTEFHGSSWLDRDAFCGANEGETYLLLEGSMMGSQVEDFGIECTSDGSREAEWKTKLNGAGESMMQVQVV